MLAENWREGLAGSKAVIVANADDPLVVWAASSSPNVIWVAAGGRPPGSPANGVRRPCNDHATAGPSSRWPRPAC